MKCSVCGLSMATSQDIERWRSGVDVADGRLTEKLPDGSIVEAGTSLCWDAVSDTARLRRDEEVATANTLRVELVRVRAQYDHVRCLLAALLKGRPVFL